MSKDTQINRLLEGGLIDRNKPLSFTFNGKRMTGYQGDTLASALIANGVEIVGRSFKYHRPRGIIGSGAEEPNAIMQIGSGAYTEPNMRATQVMLYNGLEARTIKGWPSLEFDVQEILGLGKGVFAAGFYYKTFMGPTRAAWHYFEKPIRKMSAMGVSPKSPDPDSYSHHHLHCDVLVVGGGPAGLMAAQTAALAGARVIIADEQASYGGQLLSSNEHIDGSPALSWVQGMERSLAEHAQVKCLKQSTVYAYHDYNFLTILEKNSEYVHPSNSGSNKAGTVQRVDRERVWKIRAKQVVLAQGAFERPLVFCNNDRPGVMQASAVSTYVCRYGVRPGKVAVVFTNNDSAYQAAIDLHNHGVIVAAIVDCRRSSGAAVTQAVIELGIEVFKGHVVHDVKGRNRVVGVDIAPLQDDRLELTGESRRITCDLVAMSGGWSPAVHLHSHSGGTNVWDDEKLCFVPGSSAQACISAGAGNGQFALSECLSEGAQAGRVAAERAGFAPPSNEIQLPEIESNPVQPLQGLWRVPSLQDLDKGPKQFVDYQNDVGVSDIRLAVREGFRNVEHVKRYTAMGFGTDQGKLGNINGMAILAELLNEDIPSVGTTTFRPNYTPVSFGAVAGAEVGSLYEPIRKTALHSWHETAGAEFEVVGQWHRPWYFPKSGEDLHQAVNRECLKTRKSVGIMDASTLGKIEVYGRDAQQFLEYIYTHDIAKLEVGRCAYGIMLGEDGMVKDDGVMARVGENHYYLTTTTGGAASVYAWLEFWLQTEMPHLEVFLTSTTDHNSTIALVGPNSRKVLQKLSSDLQFDQQSFPFMAVKSGTLANMPAQVFRISFSGELAFEINIHSDYAMSMWETLVDAGQEFDITPYGTETLHVLRAEKGFVIVGQDTDGSVTPGDLGMNWLLSKTKNYCGKRSLSRSDCSRDDRKQLVGLLSVDGKTVVPEGAQIIEDAVAEPPVPLCGHVTSSYYSACLEHPIALALITSGKRRIGEKMYAAPHDGRRIAVEIVKPIFYDAKGDKQRV